MTVRGFPDVLKSATDIKDVTLDWTPFAPTGETSLSDHSVSTQCGDVGAEDRGRSGLLQTIRLSGGSACAFTEVIARAVFANGIDLSRSFLVLVR